MTSDGYGDDPATGGKFDTYAEMPTGEYVLKKMVGYEIYLCRHAVEAEHARQSARKALSNYGIRVGMEFRDIEVGGEKFSTATVTAIYPESGTAKLYMARRGSKKRWETTIGADVLAKRSGLDVRRAAADAEQDLFALTA